MKKILLALFFSIISLYMNYSNSLPSVEASTYENQAGVQFYQREETVSSEQNKLDSQPSEIDIQKSLPQTGGVISSMSFLGGSVILIVWLIKKKEKTS
ncbi:LPXTG cell wall anchor domain-containing protein [Enterococcus sp. DIV0840c]|uniref:LPXTG cell wall anchor domain-containing protein n=1 Tax=Enterococcus sp. DIV0840c TaxID=2774772 RepID=UPI003D2CC910